MAYIQTYDALTVASLTTEGRAKTCGYWYCVANHSTPHTAFRTRAAFVQWLDDRGLTVNGEIPPEGEYAHLNIAGSYRTALHLDRADFDVIDGKPRLAMSNGEYTQAMLAKDTDGVLCEHTLNPNVQDRPVFDHAVSRKLQDAGQAERIPAPIRGQLP